MNKVKNDMLAIKLFIKALKKLHTKYYKDALSNNIKRALATKKQRLLSKAK